MSKCAIEGSKYTIKIDESKSKSKVWENLSSMRQLEKLLTENSKQKFFPKEYHKDCLCVSALFFGTNLPRRDALTLNYLKPWSL